MTDLLRDEGQRALCEFAAHAPLCLFDFDGTLAPLAPDPAGVLLPPAVRTKLLELQQRVPVGIVTGRSLADMRERLGFVPDYLIGNHGLEGVPGERRRHAALVEVCAGWKDWLSPRIIPGKCIFSLLPAGRGDKGEAVRQLMRFTRRERALYVGDDVTDEDVFRLPDPGIFPVRVGRSNTSAARWHIDDHHAIGSLLDELLRCIPPRARVPR